MSSLSYRIHSAILLFAVRLVFTRWSRAFMPTAAIGVLALVCYIAVLIGDHGTNYTILPTVGLPVMVEF